MLHKTVYITGVGGRGSGVPPPETTVTLSKENIIFLFKTNSYGLLESNYNTNCILGLPLSMPYLKKEKKNETPLNRLHETTYLKVILHELWVKNIFPWKFNLEYGSTFTKLFMHVLSRNMFPTTRNLQIRVHVYCPRHCVVDDWLTFGCFVPMIDDHDLVKKW